MNEKTFIDAIKELGIILDKEKMNKLNKYYNLLIEKNKIMNLTTIIEKKEVYLKHFYDSMTLCLVCDFNNHKTLCDVGTGAGFPGIVLKIIFPHLDIVLIDSLDKRVKFLKEVIDHLELKNIVAVHARAEEYARNNREKFDIVTSRAVATLPILTELCIPMVKVDKYFISMKAHVKEELENIEKNLKILNSSIEEVKIFSLPIEGSVRALIKIKKIKLNDKKYPRNFKEIKKKPL